MSAIFIYELSDPRTGEIRYVGKTDNLRRRLACHIADQDKCRKTSWIKGLKALGLNPKIGVLELSDKESWQEDEKFWIAYLKFLGFRLTNHDLGGMGAEKFSNETREKMSAAARESARAWTIEKNWVKWRDTYQSLFPSRVPGA